MTQIPIEPTEETIEIETHFPDEVRVPITQNAWLNPTDDLGKLERGVVFEDKVYSTFVDNSSAETPRIYTVHKINTLK